MERESRARTYIINLTDRAEEEVLADCVEEDEHGVTFLLDGEVALRVDRTKFVFYKVVKPTQ